MGWSASLFTIIVFGSAFVALLVCFAVSRARPDPMAWPLAVMMLMAAAWAIPHAIALGYTDIEQVAFWHRMRYVGTVFAPIAYLVVALNYAGYEQWLSRRVYAVLVVIPLLTIAAVWTNPSHGLFWESLTVARVNGASILVPEYGPWYWVNIGYLYLITVLSLVILGGVVVHSGPIYRKQAILMFLGGAAPLAVNMVINFGNRAEPIVDLTTTVLSISGLIFALALFHFDLLEIRPVARDLLIEELDDGVVVVGPDNRIHDFNSTARQVLGDIHVNQLASEVLPADIATDGGEIAAEIDGQKGLFHTRATTLTDNRGRKSGRIIYLNDVTDLVEREQRISVLNRILRHNIRNELMVVSGRLELLEGRVSESDQKHIEVANESAQRIINLAQKARNVERTLQTAKAASVVSARPATKRTIKDVRGQFPSACVDYEPCPEGEAEIGMRIVDEELFELALAELVENAIVHNDQEEPRVTVSIDLGDEWVRVNVADNGPVIPEDEKDILSSRAETNFSHGSGLGLWLVKWTVSLSGGDISFAENEPRGNQITLKLPPAGE